MYVYIYIYMYGASPSAAGPLDGLLAQWFGGFMAKLLSGSGEGGKRGGGREDERGVYGGRGEGE